MNLKFLYVRNDYKKRDITIASNLVKEGDKTVIKFGWAFRHKKDKFIKKEGRDRAVERMNSGDVDYSHQIELSDDEVGFYSIALKVLNFILSKETTPRIYFNDLLEDIQYYNYVNVVRSSTSVEERREVIMDAWNKFKLV